jgi:uncharacterized protein YxeA
MNFYKGCGLIFGTSKLYDKRHVLLILSIFLSIIVSFKTFYHKDLDGNIKFIVIQNKEAIKTIDQKRNIYSKNTYFTDKLDFTNNSKVLVDSNKKNYGYEYNFFIDFQTNFVLKKDIKITFIVYSDDGFILHVDDKKISEFKKDRPISKNEVTIFLNKGKHRYKLSYFQGGGNLGLKALYKIKDKTYVVGKNSSVIQFTK